MKERKSILGRGLEELFEKNKDLLSENNSLETREVSVLDLAPGKSQPRKFFDPERFEQLTASIKESGVLQPILVRANNTEGTKKYEIIAGERRWLAAQKAGLTKVPVIIKDIDDREALKIAIIENIQREDLNVIEEAEGYQRLIKEHNLTQEMVAQQVGKSRSHVANTLRLLALPDEVKEFVIKGQMTAGHARTLINDENALEKAKEIILKKLNVRQAEKKQHILASDFSSDEATDLANIKERLANIVQSKVEVFNKNNQVKITFTFADLWKLEDFLNTIEKQMEGNKPHLWHI